MTKKSVLSLLVTHFTGLSAHFFRFFQGDAFQVTFFLTSFDGTAVVIGVV